MTPIVRIPLKPKKDDHEIRIRDNVERVRQGQGLTDLNGLDPDDFVRKLLG